MAKMLVKGGMYYRPDAPQSSLGINMLSVLTIQPNYIKIKINYFHLKNGNIQYTGKGVSGYTDTVKITMEDLPSWQKYRGFKNETTT